MKAYPDKVGYSKRFILKYNNSFVESFSAASVDGHRMYVPIPDPLKLTITATEYAIGKIINTVHTGDSFDNYLLIADIKVEG